MYPHERSLVKRMENRPFALIGVNSDKDKAVLKKALEKEQIRRATKPASLTNMKEGSVMRSYGH